MKKTVFVIVLIVALAAPAVFAQSLKGMSLNGATGLIGIPSGRIGWERTSDFGFDLGYHAIIDDDDANHIPKASVSLFRLLEISGAYDIQDDNNSSIEDESDLIIGGKIQLPTEGTAVAIGGNAQMIKINDESYQATQIYLAATYPGSFFEMPAETTFVVGKSFGDDEVTPGDEAIDFGMGFDLILFPEVFQGYVHWINDFANFSYSQDPRGVNAGFRGAFNTGIRIDVAANPSLSKYKFVIDAIMTDALDENRAFALGLAFGAPLM
ncbi:MAG: hypothetical protein PF508_20245 [Spirochaeta sp.]|nr:hypothetical protein [Spirochaeta sp.]